jgi:hypothetical protein
MIIQENQLQSSTNLHVCGAETPQLKANNKEENTNFREEIRSKAKALQNDQLRKVKVRKFEESESTDEDLNQRQIENSISSKTFYKQESKSQVGTITPQYQGN